VDKVGGPVGSPVSRFFENRRLWEREKRNRLTPTSGTVLFWFVAHCFFTSTQGFFNDLLIFERNPRAVHVMSGAQRFMRLGGLSDGCERRKRAHDETGTVSGDREILRPVSGVSLREAVPYAQNKALEYLTPAFLSVTYGAPPVLVAVSCVLIGWEPL